MWAFVWAQSTNPTLQKKGKKIKNQWKKKTRANPLFWPWLLWGEGGRSGDEKHKRCLAEIRGTLCAPRKFNYLEHWGDMLGRENQTHAPQVKSKYHSAVQMCVYEPHLQVSRLWQQEDPNKVWSHQRGSRIEKYLVYVTSAPPGVWMGECSVRWVMWSEKKWVSCEWRGGSG